jgi:dTDP-4-dehydrorhamnose reductase
VKILITGSTGFLGKALVRLINKKNNNLYYITRKNKKKKNNFCCNLENLKKVKYITNLIKPDVVINLAAKINFNAKKKIYKVNSLAPKIFAEYCKKNNKHLIHASSISVNGIHSLYNHRTKLHPVNTYGKTKLIAEKYIQKSKCNYSIIRFAGIYGGGGGSSGDKLFYKSSY